MTRGADHILVRTAGFPIRSWVSVLLLVLSAGPLFARPDEPLFPEDVITPDGIHVLDGSCVLTLGRLHVNITNHGLIGSQFNAQMPYSDAPSAQWPGGSGHEYLWGAGLWVGARLRNGIAVSTGQYDRELRPSANIEDTIYEAQYGIINRPTTYPVATGRRYPEYGSDDDGDGARDEDLLNGRDDDDDGLVDEDFGQRGNQMFTCSMYDNLPLIREIYPDHEPLDIKVVQRAAAWNLEGYRDVVGLDFEITNIGFNPLQDVYLGFFADCDIQRRFDGHSDPDDLAGMWSGALRGQNGSFYRINLAWMKDAAPSNPVPGYFGIMLLDHTTDPNDYNAPNLVGVNSFQIFKAHAAFNQQGLPSNDSERYFLMEREQWDEDTLDDEAGDLKVLISSGPFRNISPGATVHYRLAMVMGSNMDELLENALRAAEMGRGARANFDNNYYSGRGGRETKICLGDLDWGPGQHGTLFDRRADMMDESCVPHEMFFMYERISPDMLFVDADGRQCIWVNADNCEECFRGAGQECTKENRLYGSQYSVYSARTGTYGRETQVPWIASTEMPPASPLMRPVPGDRRVELFWDDRSEYEIDTVLGVNDFESYRVWRAQEWTRPPGVGETSPPPAELWAMIDEYDVVNEIPAGVGTNNVPVSLGRNTGLEDAVYIPGCLSDDRYADLAVAMRQVVEADTAGEMIERPSLRNPDGSVVPHLAGLIRWEAHPDVLDTFFAVTPRAAGQDIVGKRSVRYYHYVDDTVHNGMAVHYAVTASDHRLVMHEGELVPAGYGIQEDPAYNYILTTPRPPAQSPEARARDGVNIYVYPNPATREALADFLQQPPSGEDPTGVRVMFNNLPQAYNTIRIFTVAGDLITTLTHDGRNGGGGSVSWNLMSRNKQEVVSGIYIYTVHSDDDCFETFQGRFVVVR